MTGFQAGQTTWFETAPLMGGGLAIRRVDQQDDAGGRPYRTAQWLATSQDVNPGPHGEGLSLIPPKWLSDRPNTNLSVALGGKAYAVLPLGAPAADCAQKIEILAPDGTSCGFFDATVARGQCRTEDVALGRDGTPIQLLPQAMAQPGA